MQRALTPGERISHYRVDAEIGRGGMGVVYRAYDERLDRVVALKVIRPSEAFEYSGLNKIRARFQREAQLAARLSHPGIVTIYAFEQLGDLDLIAMELVQGESLLQLIERGHRWEPRAAAELVAQISEAVAAAHAIGIVHRDLKPANVVLLPDGRPKVLDFGIAKASGVDTRLSGTSTVVGTVGHMAPEQVLGSEVTPATDVFSLGVILYELVTGERPFGEGSPVTVGMRVVNDEPPLLELPQGREVFGPIYNQLTEALAKEPSRRPADAAALAERLRAEDPVPAPRQETWTLPLPGGSEADPERSARRKGPPPASLVRGVVAALVLALLASGFYAIQGRSGEEDAAPAAPVEDPQLQTGPQSDRALFPVTFQSTAGVAIIIEGQDGTSGSRRIASVGTTGSTTQRLAPGRYRVLFQAPGQQPWETDVEVAPGTHPIITRNFR